MNKKDLFLMYVTASLAFTLALLKYLFVEKYYILEILSFILFLILVYYADNSIRLRRKENLQFEKDLEQTNNNYKKQINQLNDKIEQLEIELLGGQLSENEIDLITDKIFSEISNVKDQNKIAKILLDQLAHYYEIGVGLCYLRSEPSEKFSVQGVYGLNEDEIPGDIDLNDGLHGQSVNDKSPRLLNDIDEAYFNIESCLGSSKPKHLYLLPIVKEDIVIGFLELATFKTINIEKHWEIINGKISDLLYT